jgi:large subunit ribosomal protein L14
MIQMGSRLVVADNSGAKEAACIMLLGKGSQKIASIGDRIVVSIKSAINGGIVKEGDVSKAVIVRTKKEIRRKNGEYIRFGENAIILINDNGEPKGSRVFGPIARELKKYNFSKIVSLAKEVL